MDAKHPPVASYRQQFPMANLPFSGQPTTTPLGVEVARGDKQVIVEKSIPSGAFSTPLMRALIPAYPPAAVTEAPNQGRPSVQRGALGLSLGRVAAKIIPLETGEWWQDW